MKAEKAVTASEEIFFRRLQLPLIRVNKTTQSSVRKRILDHQISAEFLWER